jgi:hypothetical protein
VLKASLPPPLAEGKRQTKKNLHHNGADTSPKTFPRDLAGLNLKRGERSIYGLEVNITANSIYDRSKNIYYRYPKTFS